MSHDQNFKNLILDYPHQALAFFAPEEAADGLPEATIMPVRQEQLKEPSWLLVSSIRPPAWYAGHLCRPSIIMMKSAEDRKRDDLSAGLGD